MKRTGNSPFLIEPEYDATGRYSATLRSLLFDVTDRIDKSAYTTNVYVFLTGPNGDKIVGMAWSGFACNKHSFGT